MLIYFFIVLLFYCLINDDIFLTCHVLFIWSRLIKSIKSKKFEKMLDNKIKKLNSKLKNKYIIDMETYFKPRIMRYQICFLFSMEGPNLLEA